MNQKDNFEEYLFKVWEKSHNLLPVVSFSEFLLEWRTKAHYSQQELADRLEVDRRTENRWERGKAFPNITNLRRIAEVLHIPYESLKPYLAFYKHRHQTVAPTDCSLNKCS